MIGPWALYNGTNLASYTVAQGVIGAGDSAFADLSAKGPSVLPNDAAAFARINTEGTEGGIALTAETENSLRSLMQATVWDASVGLFERTDRLVVTLAAAFAVGVGAPVGPVGKPAAAPWFMA